jgi:hypothetical protein
MRRLPDCPAQWRKRAALQPFDRQIRVGFQGAFQALAHPQVARFHGNHTLGPMFCDGSEQAGGQGGISLLVQRAVTDLPATPGQFLCEMPHSRQK